MAIIQPNLNSRHGFILRQAVKLTVFLEFDARCGSDEIHYLRFAVGNVLGARLTVNGKNIILCRSGSWHFLDTIVNECP